jgi:hypothetical protein
MRKPLRDLKRFIGAKNNEDERAEIRACALENAAELAVALGVACDSFRAAVAGVEDDEKLASALLGMIKRAERDRLAERVEARALAAQQSADLLGSVAQWEGNAAGVDILSLFASALTRRGEMLVFRSDAFAVAVHMAPLMALANVGKVDLTAFVDAEGLHVRWNDGKGGIHLRPQTDPDAFKVFVNLCARMPVAGAAAA